MDCGSVCSGLTSSPRTSRHHERQKGQLCSHPRSSLPGLVVRLLRSNCHFPLRHKTPCWQRPGDSGGHGRELKMAQVATQRAFLNPWGPVIAHPWSLETHTCWHPSSLPSQRLTLRTSMEASYMRSEAAQWTGVIETACPRGGA